MTNQSAHETDESNHARPFQYISLVVFSRLCVQVLPMLLARHTNPNTFGRFAVIQITLSLLLTFFDFGTGRAILMSPLLRPNESAYVRVFLSFAGSILSFLFLALAGQSAYSYWSFLLFPIGVGSTISIVKRTQGKLYSAAAIDASILAFPALIALRWPELTATTPEQELTHPALILWVATILFVIWFERAHRLSWAGHWRTLLMRGRSFFVSAVCISIYARTDRLILSYIEGNDSAGQYAAGYALVFGWSLFSLGFDGLILADLSRLVGNQSLFETRFKLWRRRLVLIGISCGGIHFAFSSLAISQIYGKQFSKAGTVALILTPLAFFYIVNPLLNLQISLLGGQAKVANLTVATSVLALIFYSISIRLFGMNGLALVSVALEVWNYLVLNRLGSQLSSLKRNP